MKRLLVNGSPRGRESNSRLIIQWLCDGLASAGAAVPNIIDLADTKKIADQREKFMAAEEVVIVLPLYTDSLPGIVKNFLDTLASADKAQSRGKRLAFIIQSGFPESIHSEALAQWLARLCVRMGWVNCGIAIKGGVEGIRVMPPSMSRKLREQCVALAVTLAEFGAFDQTLVSRMAAPRTLGWGMRALITLQKPFGLMNFYWNMNLKKHNAWKKRFDRPFAR